MSDQNLLAELEALKQENQKLKAQKSKEVFLKVSAKGAVSVYGLQRFPVTLYANQMEKLLEQEDQIRQFIVDNKDKLSTQE